MTPTATIGVAGAPIRAATAVVAAVGALAVGGGGLVVAGLGSGERPSVVREAPASAAWDATTSVGPMSVQRVERFAGPPHGGGHGATERSDRIRVSLTLTSTRKRRVPFSPGQFRLRLDGSGVTVAATRPNPPPASIAAGETLRPQLTFVVPAASASFALVFDDVGRPRPLPIVLGSLPREGKG
jgi:hypothetical protein